ncbi:YozQ family protein [Bacillus dakarensis]|uniref:YozQ family protein n=1 Tax=Robertmurraya dakarensis TaxID=1926278 RepID=UPI0009812CD8|nr:YozQ family protein [Bacillus dakarensis]
MKDKLNEESAKIANRYFNPEDYQKEDQMSSALAETHEQVSDTFAEGEIKAVIDDVNGEDIPVERKGFEK